MHDYYSNYSSIRYYSDVTNLLEINDGSGHRYSSSLSDPLHLSSKIGSRSIGMFYKIKYSCALFAVPLIRNC